MRRTLITTGLAALAVVAVVSPSAAANAAAGPGTSASKGRPPSVGAPAPPSTSLLATSFLYASSHQFATTDGATGQFKVAVPFLASSDFHTLAELAVESTDGTQIVEVGWTVDRGVNGDAQPHLFVFHWIDGVPTCYNGCGFVQRDSLIRPGMTLVNGATYEFKIQHFQGNWWIGVGLTWVGYFPDSRWGGRYTKAGLVQWFGEVAASSTAPCTDMGNGLFSSNTSANTISNMTFIGSTSSVNVTASSTHPGLYTATRTAANAIRYGGPGAC